MKQSQDALYRHRRLGADYDELINLKERDQQKLKSK